MSELSPASRAGLLVMLGALVVILAALAFEYIGGYAPCALCLQQRYAYYACIPLGVLALVLISAGRDGAAAVTFLVVALAFLANAALATYHAGAEWELWPGPESCTAGGPLSTNAGDLLRNLATTRVVPCTQPALRIFGLSLAAWNVVASLALAVGGAWAATRAAGVEVTTRTALHPTAWRATLGLAGHRRRAGGADARSANVACARRGDGERRGPGD